MRLRIIPIFLLLWVGVAHADQAGEREHLARLAHEIEALKALVDAAQAQADLPHAHPLPVHLAQAGLGAGPPRHLGASQCASG
jgi:Plasmid protein of unknown function (Plasmid_RAQPRD)